jgi:ribokinase
MKQAHVVVLGSVNVDLVLRCTALPVPGQTVKGGDFQRLTGGKGANQAVAAARMGARVRFVGAVGTDESGRDARDQLRAEGIDIRHLKEERDVATGAAMILVDEASGQNCIALYEGANAHVDTALVDRAADDIASAALLVCQLETPLAATLQAARIARAAGVPVLLNPAPAVPLDAALLASVDILVPNESEAMVLPGQCAADAFDPDHALGALLAKGARSVLITLGADGVLYGDRETRLRRVAHVAQAIDTSGAGDAFIGAFAAALVSGRPLESAIDFAQRAASLSVTRRGAMASLARACEIA